MLLSLQSTGPQYNHLQTNIQIPWNCEYIKYHVASINTRDILLTTSDDVIEYEWNAAGATINCENKYEMTRQDVIDLLQNNGVLNAALNDKGQIELTPLVPNFRFRRITHRAGIVTGLYNIDITALYPPNVPIVGERPILDYANKLYLVSKQGQAIQSNIGNVEYTPSVIASIDHMIMEDLSIMQNFETYGKPIKNVCNIDSFKQIELELVDFQYQPVTLMSPMFITIKIKPCKNPKMKLT